FPHLTAIYLIFITIFKMRTHPRLKNLTKPTYYGDSTLAFLLSQDISIILVLSFWFKMVYLQ
ncbi:MAG: hypothetical protein ACTH5O_08385, partial [Psychrobacter sp.]